MLSSATRLAKNLGAGEQLFAIQSKSVSNHCPQAARMRSHHPAHYPEGSCRDLILSRLPLYSVIPGIPPTEGKVGRVGWCSPQFSAHANLPCLPNPRPGHGY